VTIQYQVIYEEFIEASKALAAVKAKSSGTQRGINIALIVVYFYVATMFWSWVPGMDGLLVFVHLILPIILGLAACILVSITSSLVAGKVPKVTWQGMVFLGVLALLVAEIFGMRALHRLTHPGVASRISLDWKLLLPHSTWLFFLTWFLIVVFNKQRKGARKLWDGQPAFHRLKTADISAAGVVISDDQTRLEYRWPGFAGWRETKNLFLLLTSSKTSWFLPKRAFPGEEELKAMRALCELIPKSADVAFPVGPASPPPLPLETVESK
jgi:hypothetical protein